MRMDLRLLGAMLAAERVRLFGAKGYTDPHRIAILYDSDDGEVVLGGRRLAIRRHRVRTVEGVKSIVSKSDSRLHETAQALPHRRLGAVESWACVEEAGRD